MQDVLRVTTENLNREIAENDRLRAENQRLVELGKRILDDAQKYAGTLTVENEAELRAAIEGK